MHGEVGGHLLELRAAQNFQAGLFRFSAQAEQGGVEVRLLRWLARAVSTGWFHSHLPQAAKASCFAAGEAG
jgi:hypothetical protein